jgi:DNA-directed RNA polymerase alpha subunit
MSYFIPPSTATEKPYTPIEVMFLPERFMGILLREKTGSLEELSAKTEEEVRSFHGIGKMGIDLIKRGMKKQKFSFSPTRHGKKA